MENYFNTKKSFSCMGPCSAPPERGRGNHGPFGGYQVPIDWARANADVFARDIEISENRVSFSIVLRAWRT